MDMSLSHIKSFSMRNYEDLNDLSIILPSKSKKSLKDISNNK